MRHDPAVAAIVIMLRELKMHGMAQAVTELATQGAPAFEAAQPILSQLLKAETAEREVRSVAYQLKDHQIGIGQPVCQLAGLAAELLLLQCGDQFHGREEPHPAVVVLNGLHTQGRGNVGLAGARAAHEHHVVGLLQELAAM